MTRPARLVALLIVVLAAFVGPAQAARTHRVVTNGQFAYKPHEITISGDGDFWVQNLGWRSWGGKTAVAHGQAIEQVHPSHVNHTYPTRVTLSQRTFCPNLHRTVYNKIIAEILTPNAGIFGDRTLGRVYTCAGTWRLVSSRPSTTGTTRPSAKKCSTQGIPPYISAINEHGSTCTRARTLVLAWTRRVKAPGGGACLWVDGSTRPGVCRVRAWRCSSYHTVNGANFPVICRTDGGRRRVRFIHAV